MSDWITDRSPTEEDGEFILASLPDMAKSTPVMEIRWQVAAREGWPWMRRPEPYQPPPPEPDTSLEASIERQTPHVSPDTDWGRIIAAARKWDDLERRTDKVMPRIKAMIDDAIEDIGESEHGQKYQDRTTGGEQPAKVRREWKWKKNNVVRIISPACTTDLDGCHIREVFPGDPDPEWTEELIRLCEEEGNHLVKKIRNHLAKRGDT